MTCDYVWVQPPQSALKGPAHLLALAYYRKRKAFGPTEYANGYWLGVVHALKSAGLIEPTAEVGRALRSISPSKIPDPHTPDQQQLYFLLVGLAELLLTPDVEEEESDEALPTSTV